MYNLLLPRTCTIVRVFNNAADLLNSAVAAKILFPTQYPHWPPGFLIIPRKLEISFHLLINFKKVH